ncbi:MAG: RNB domain-containing ribonuclease, partial [Clostridia bacterium]|nr:RNB domain-containing ribonuclease [Clostridia bacterium]
MLPKSLSNGICSLNGGADRLTLSCFVTLDKSGSIISTEIKKSVINSKIRGVYSELNDILKKGENSDFYPKYRHILDSFYEMMELYKILKLRSEQKGAMELESDEIKILLNEVGHPYEIVKRDRGESEKLIEQFMLTANEAVATFLYNASVPCVYRVHEEPDHEKINAFSLFARNLGVDTSSLRTKNTITPNQLSRVLKSAEEKGVSMIVSSVLLRSLMKAKYSAVQGAHFGLNTEYYCHFTSPIRRYPDLSVHRILKAFLDGKLNEETTEKYERFAALSADMSSENEIKAIHAERDIEQLYKCVYMQDKIDEEYDAVICSVTSFGFFAKTENLCEGLVSVDDLGNGFYFDKDNYTLSRGKTTYRLGAKVRVRVDSVDIALKQINFSLVKEKKQITEGDENEPIVKEKISYKKKESVSHNQRRKNRTRDTYRKRKR